MVFPTPAAGLRRLRRELKEAARHRESSRVPDPKNCSGSAANQSLGRAGREACSADRAPRSSLDAGDRVEVGASGRKAAALAASVLASGVPRFPCGSACAAAAAAANSRTAATVGAVSAAAPKAGVGRRDRFAKPVLALPGGGLYIAAANPRRGLVGGDAPCAAAPPEPAAEAPPAAWLEADGRRFFARRRGWEASETPTKRRRPDSPQCTFPVSFVHFPTRSPRCNSAESRIGDDVLLHIQIVEQLEICVHVVILVQCLKIADRAAGRFHHHGGIGQVGAVPPRQQNTHTHSEQHRERTRQHRLPKPSYPEPTRLRFRHFLPQAGFETRIKIWRRFRDLPFIEQ